ncbi:MAG TPA: PLP-dependent aminotransferase family protein [Aminobacterium sp.]|jgi:DNA-binding transcriptional MocR family regulator|uniref:aminotransferase-like domain-containing protein n=1 Tax=Aminobacterium TaxID=81466 RepID=UPI000ED862DA|nr:MULTISPECIES: PLP-dependent aminotransferase family protein [unclassified Aminobacterium]HCA40684.1 PLP-dependent aminotransferase family protein [Aminobacterium sp.]
MLEIPLNRKSEVPLYRQIALHLQKMIERGALLPKTKLPGSRGLAQSLGVGRITVMEAYKLLSDYGYVVELGRSGTYVSERSVSDDYFTGEFDHKWDFRTGQPTPDLIPSEELSRVARDVLAFSSKEALCEAPLSGLDSLRHVLVKHAASRGIPASWREVFVTAGGRQGIALSLNALKQLGVRQMWVEKLTYPDAIMMAQSEGIEIKVLPPLEDISEKWYECLSGSHMLYLVPSFQNPTGQTISESLRHVILEGSMKYGFWVLEDDAYGELRYGERSISALKALDGSERVVYLGSFSQVLFPGLRIGYSLVPNQLMESFVQAQAKRYGPVSSLDQLIVERFIESKGLESALTTTRGVMESRMKTLGASLRVCVPEGDFLLPEGGIYLWLNIPGIDGREAAFEARKAGVLVASGNQFSYEGERVEAVRFAVSSIVNEGISSAVRCLQEVWRQAFYSKC